MQSALVVIALILRLVSQITEKVLITVQCVLLRLIGTVAESRVQNLSGSIFSFSNSQS